jgi:hypothetical protein
VNQLLAKLTSSEKYEAGGIAAVVVGWIAGLILGNSQECVTVFGQTACGGSLNYFTWGTAGLFGILALVLAIVAGIVLYMKIAPNVKVAWPMPVTQILLAVCVATLVCAALMVLIQLTNGGSPPALMYVADAIMVVGAAAMSWFAYQEWMAKPAA